LINKILTISEISRSFTTYYMIISKNNDFLSGISHLRKKKKKGYANSKTNPSTHTLTSNLFHISKYPSSS
jgi:hypothetical protein